MAENIFQASLIRLRVLLRMIRPFRGAYAILAGFFLMAPLLESYTVTLIIPLFGLMLGGPLGAVAIPPALEAALRPFLTMPLGSVCLLFAGLAVARGFASYYTYAQNDRLSHLVGEYWMNYIFDNYVNASFEAVAGRGAGMMANNIIYETYYAREMLVQMMTLLASSVSCLIYFSFLLLIEWRITLGFGVAAAIFLFFVSRFSTRIVLGLGKERVASYQQAAQTISEALQGLREIKAFSLEQWVAAKLREFLRRIARTQVSHSLLIHVPRHFQDAFIVVAFVSGVWLFSRFAGSRTGMMFPAVIAYALMAIRLVRLLDEILTTQLAAFYNLPSLRTVQAEMESPLVRRRQSGTRHIAAIESDIQIEKISFSYSKDKPALIEASLFIPRRGMTALAGPSGCGKTTLADLLLRLYDPQQGRIMIGDVDLREIDPISWRQRIGFVAQDGYLFSGTIRENIAIGSPGASEQEIIEALRIANAWEFIEPLEQGLDSVIGERGVGLSGGQRQRLRIARAIIRKPDLLIFDEATSALDARSESLIQSAIEDISARM
ncbi:MAG: ABC transporter ATP-binding protein, partial [Candidatus Sumerlaeota bacterium]|nr:ABC transporter ATP-binding protein [Candidatus Sumerlaeota bacterium]